MAYGIHTYKHEKVSITMMCHLSFTATDDEARGAASITMMCHLLFTATDDEARSAASG
jgi:hypothetical protein